jgi:hypothetical protein
LALAAYLAAVVAAALGHNHTHAHAESEPPAALAHAHPRADDHHHHSTPAHEHDDCAACRFLIQPASQVAAPPVLVAPRPLVFLSTAEYLSAAAPLPRDYDSRGPPALA